MELDLIKNTFQKLGFETIFVNEKPSANGPDMYVQKKGRRPLSVEIKRVRKQKNGMYQVEPVQKNRKTDDVIAIIVNSNYVLIEPMSDHLKCCSPKGTRQFTSLMANLNI